MNSDDADITFTYETDVISADQWRDVMAACQAYERRLLDDQSIRADDFALHFSSIPSHVLIPELERLRTEFLESADSSRSTNQEDDSQPERYLILEEIRSGGMGQVFRAFDRNCNRLVAIKKIRQEFAEDRNMRHRFLAEVQLTADLEHPGVIPIYDQSIDGDGREFYVMRLIHGDGSGTLHQAIRAFHTTLPGFLLNRNQSWNSAKRSEFRKLIESVLVVADTTAHAHSRGIAHRDLKPSNVLVNAYGETLLADWGLAKRIDSRLTTKLVTDSTDLSHFISTEKGAIRSNTQGVGTMGFRAPEVESGSSDANPIAADIYSLGAILECVIHGSVNSSSESGHRIVESKPPASLLPLIAIAKKAMASDVASRYESAQAMRVDLSNWLAGEPVTAYPESFVERLWNWPTRHRLLASAIAGALIIALIASGLISLFQTVQKDRLGRALQTSSQLLEENQRAKESLVESFAQRESLALHAIIEFQSLLTLNPLLQSDTQFRPIREKVLRESRSFYESLEKSVDQSTNSDDESLGRLTDAAVALVLLENELGNFSDALRIAETACQRLRKTENRSQRLQYHLGRVLAFKGNIATRNGWKQQGLADQEEAVRLLEPLVDSNQLNPQDRSNAAILWSRAASPMAIGLAAKGDFQGASALLQRILATLNGRQPETFQDALLKVQSYGNLALVRFYSKDNKGTHESLDQAESATTRCENLIDGSIPFREIIEFEVLRCTLVRFKSDLMITEGKVDLAIELQTQSLAYLTDALNRYPGNLEIQLAYHSCSTRLQTVLIEQGRTANAKEVAHACLQLAKRIQTSEDTSPGTSEFLLLAYHSMGHLTEKTSELQEAERCYREALSIATSLLTKTPESANLLSATVELNVHLIRYELSANRLQVAESHLDESIRYGSKLKSLPDSSESQLSGLSNQMNVALRFLQDSEQRDKKEAWTDKLKTAGLLP
ncbi:MAG: protein kinase domain-containing protein [Pirellulaceae bacterium]